MQEGTASRVMAGDKPYGKFYYLYSVNPEYLGLHHVSSFLDSKLPSYVGKDSFRQPIFPHA
jgi:hypothetical protein